MSATFVMKGVDGEIAPYGAMRTVMSDHIYLPEEHASIYTSPCISALVSTPFDVLIAITACRQPLTLQVGSNIEHGSALAVAARARRMHAQGVRMVILQLGPFNPAYRLFRRLQTVLKIDREKFAHLDEHLEAAYCGRLSFDESQTLCRGVLDQITQLLPAVQPLDARVQETMRLLFDNPRLPLEQLAAHCGLSYDRMSHLFIDELGISIRSFQVWVKLRRALKGVRHGRSLVELAQIAGFSDAAHLSRVYKQVFGAPPSYFYYSGNVKLIASYAGEIPGTPRPSETAA